MRYYALLAAALMVSSAFAGDGLLSVATGGKRTIDFDAKVATFYIADPNIIDATATDDRHIVLIGKARGTSEILALDAQGAEILRSRVVVAPVQVRARKDTGGTLTLLRGSEHVTYACGDSACRVSARGGGAKADAVALP
jgi:Flp pilus assembly secretin CpaC